MKTPFTSETATDTLPADTADLLASLASIAPSPNAVARWRGSLVTELVTGVPRPRLSFSQRAMAGSVALLAPLAAVSGVAAATGHDPLQGSANLVSNLAGAVGLRSDDSNHSEENSSRATGTPVRDSSNSANDNGTPDQGRGDAPAGANSASSRSSDGDKGKDNTSLSVVDDKGKDSATHDLADDKGKDGATHDLAGPPLSPSGRMRY